MRMLLIVVAALVAGCSEPKPLTVLAAASTEGALSEVISAFSEEFDIEVRLVTGASNQLARQISAGVPADIFLPASAAWASDFPHQRPLLSNRLCVVVPRGSGLSEVLRIALAGEEVPAGVYGSEALTTLNFPTAEVVRGQSVRTALAWVARGEVDAGIVYQTDAATTRAVEVALEIPKSAHSPILYPAVRLNSEEETQRFFDYLFTERALAMFEAHGFFLAP